jgi:WD40 repeat protein
MLEVRFNTKWRSSVAIGYCMLLVVLAISSSLLEAQDQVLTAYNPLPLDISITRGNFSKSPTQDIFAIGLEGGTVVLWDFQTREIIRTLEGQFELSDRSLTWSPDGRLIAATSFDTLIWDAKTGELLPSWVGCCEPGYGVPEGTQTLAISPDSTILVNAPATHVWDIASGELLHTLSDHLLSIDQFLISPDGSTVMADPYLFGAALVWDIQSGELVHQIPSVTTLAISPDGSMLAVSVNLKEKPLYRISILDSDTYEELQGFDVAFFPYKLTWTPDNLMLLVGVKGWSWVSEDLIDNGF